MKTITVKTDPKTKDSYIELSDLEDLYDISKVKKYTMEQESGVIVLKLFDNKGKQITDQPKFLTLQQVSKKLAMSESKILSLVSKNKLKIIEKNGESHFIKTDVEKFKKNKKA